MNTSDLDLNLLKVFDAIYQERSVSRAAVRVGLTQPTVSHALARLRTAFRDPLFLRAKGGVVPTPTAHRVAPELAFALRAVQNALDDASRFDPATAKRVFRVHMSDLAEMVFLPPLIRALRERAPHVTLETRQFTWDALPAALENGAIDLAIGHLPFLRSDFAHLHLFREEYVTLRRTAAGRREPPAGYIAITSHPPTLAMLRESGLIDRVKLAMPHFLVVPSILAEVDYAVIVPRAVALAFARDGFDRIATLPAPVPMAQRHFDVDLFWMRRQDTEPGNRWMRALMVELFHRPADRKRRA